MQYITQALKRRLTYLIVFQLLSIFLLAQRPTGSTPGRSGAANLPGSIRGITGGMQGGGGGGQSIDSLEHRDPFEDSISISFQLPLSALQNKLDSSVTDFTKRFPIPAHHIFLGNNGTATRSILFSPNFQSGWDPGFHAFDVYRWKPESVRFFNTSRPFTELAYLLGGRTEQIIEITHTQNIKPNWNGLFQYRLINAPGFFKNQKTNHNNYLLTSWYQSINKRYNNYFVLVSNAMQSEENGGLKNDQDYLNDPVYIDRFNIPTQLGGDVAFGRNFFSSKMNTGNRYTDFNVVMTQQYDIGKKDSLVKDTIVIPLFYPRLRFEHTFRMSKYKFMYMDNAADTVYYKNVLNFPGGLAKDTISLNDTWNEMVNDFSIYQYPDAKNLQQFFKAGITIQNLKGEFATKSVSTYNLSVHGEYRNKTKNRKWDMAAAGTLYVNGFNAGDYHASFGLKRFAGKRQSYIELGFRNVNRTPSFTFDNRSSFYLTAPKNFNKENTTHLSASYFQPKLKAKISGNYFLVSNYTYFTEFIKPQQENALFNLLMITLEKKFNFWKNFVWYTDIYFQKKTGSVPLNVPLVFTRNRIGYEGNLGFKNLTLSTGLEIRYHTPYKADGYSSPLGSFYYQDSISISNRPEVSAYFHFRIRNFRAFVRAENLNSVSTTNGFGFRYHNFAAPDYAYPGMVIRVGIFWNFVN